MNEPSLLESNDASSDVESDESRPCILSGEIRSTSALCDIISFLAHAGWWGELVVEHGADTRSLFFDQSHVVAALSTSENERLGAVLCRCEALTQEQADTAAALGTERNIRFGEAVVELGYLEREKLFSLMRKQVEAIFEGIVAVENGKFLFYEGFEDADLSFRHKQSVDGLLLEAISKMEETKHFRARIPTGDHVPVRASDVPPPPSDPHGVYAAIDGTRTVAEVAENIGIAELEVTRALFQHVHTGHAAIASPRMPVSQTVEIYNEAIAVLLRELDAIDVGETVRAQLAKFASIEAEDGTFAPVTPADDGTLDLDETKDKIARSSDPRAAEERLGKWLYDYASYAVFLARPHLERRDGRVGVSGRVSRRVAQILDPIAPSGERTLMPPGLADLPAVSDLPRTTLPAEAEQETTGERRIAETQDAADGADKQADADEREPGEKRETSLSTQRLRKSAGAVVPGIDTSRTLRMGSVSQEQLDGRRTTSRLQAVAARAQAAVVKASGAMGAVRAVPAVSQGSAVASATPMVSRVPAAPPGARRGHPAARLPGPPAPLAAVAPAPSSTPDAGVRRPLVALIAISCVAVGALVAGRGSTSAESTAARPPHVREETLSPSPAPPAPKLGGGAGGELVVACDPECGAVYVDGKRAPSPHEPVVVAAGAHDIVVTRPGFGQQTKRITVAAGHSEAVAFQLVRAAP